MVLLRSQVTELTRITTAVSSRLTPTHPCPRCGAALCTTGNQTWPFWVVVRLRLPCVRLSAGHLPDLQDCWWQHADVQLLNFIVGGIINYTNKFI